MSDKRVALITGANQGIGLQIAKDLAAADMTVLIGSRDLAKGEDAAGAVDGDAHAIQLDVTDTVSIAAAASRIEADYGRLDVLINNAGISNVGRDASIDIEEYAKLTLPSVVSMDEMRSVWETNVFAPLMVYQAMLPLLRKSSRANIVNVSSGAGSLTLHSNPEFPYRKGFRPLYHASKTGLNAITLAMAIELEAEGIKVNAASPGPTKTALNNYQGTETVAEGASEVVRLALAGPDGPTGTFSHAKMGKVPW